MPFAPVTRGGIVALQIPGHRLHLASVARCRNGGETVESCTVNSWTIKAPAYQEAAKRLFPIGDTWADEAALRAAIMAEANKAP